MTLKPIEKIILYLIITFNTLFAVLILSGNMPLNGLMLTGALKSTAKHEHGRYDNSFITGVNYVFNPDTMEFESSIEGTSIETVNLRVPGGSISGGYFVNDGALYQHGNIMFEENNNFKKKKVYLTTEQTEKFYTIELKNSGFIKDDKGWYKEVTDPLAAGFVNCSGMIQIIPDYKNKGVEIVGTYIDREGVHKVAPEEVDRIKNICKEEILKSNLDKVVKDEPKEVKKKARKR